MWSAGDKNTLNAILKDGESITYKLDEKQENCTFFIEFNDEDNNVAVIKHLQTFRTFIKYYFKDLTELELTKIEELLLKTYKKKNIDLDTDVSKLSSKDYPIITDFHNEIKNELENAKKALQGIQDEFADIDWDNHKVKVLCLAVLFVGVAYGIIILI